MCPNGDHAIVAIVAADDRDVLDRLAALEAEVKADADAQKARKAAALAKLRQQQADKEADKQAVAERDAARVRNQARRRDRDDDDDGGVDTAMTLARGAKLAGRAKAELSRPRQKGQKSWMASGLLSLFFGPVGWVYAGSLREAVPAGALYLAAMLILSKLPVFLMWPVMMVALPISGIAGVVYALQYNRHGKRQRLFDRDDGKKKLRAGDES
jgi:hypothetical protein